MRRKHSILRTVVFRFVCYYFGIELIHSVLEDLVSTMAARMESGQILPAVLWGLIQLLVFGVGVALFAYSISRKVSYPAGRMVKGFQEVSNGNLDITLEFETETEFKEMRDAFNLMAHNLKDSEEKRLSMENERMRLFSHIAHDLKTPMTTITGYAGALADGMVEEPDKQREYHLAIQTKSSQMNELLDQLLFYSKLGVPQYKMQATRTDLAELLRASCAALFGEMENKQMELELRLPDVPVFGEVDVLELNRAIGNLITNAIRHNPPGTLLSVGLVEEPEHIALQIIDSGTAIPAEIAKNLFEPYISGSDSRSSGTGTGLGLAIAKKVAQQHSGEVFVSDAPAPYTKMFVLRLPKK